ncbi:Gag polyprotein [Plecturocebus cupreus]
MGQLESKEHKLFVHLLQSMIKSQGHDVKLNIIEEFVHIVREICPWVPEGGVLDEPAWHVIGEKIEQFCFYNKELPQSNILLSVWSKLRGCVCPSLPSAPPYAATATTSPAGLHTYAAPAPVAQEDKSERHSVNSHTEYQPDLLETLTEVVVDPVRTPQTTPQWTHGPVTFTLPPDLARQFQDLLSLCSRALTNQPQFYPVQVQQPTAAGASMPVALRSTASAPISPLTHALMSLHRGLSDSDNMFPASFSVIEVVDNQGNPIRNYESIPLKMLKELKEAVAQYGPTAPYTISLIENLTISALPPTDWGRLTKACLSSGDYLLWRANYEDGAYEQAERNRRQQSPVTLDMLSGRGQFEPLAAQATLPTEAFAQINTLATRAWQQLPSTGVKTEELSKIRQGPDEPYQDFVSRLLQAIGRQVQDSEAGTLLVRQLAYENANAACQAAIRPWDLLWLAAAQAGMTVAAFIKQKFSWSECSGVYN